MSTPYKPELSAMIHRLLPLILLWLIVGCRSGTSRTEEKSSDEDSTAFVIQELLIKDRDTAMVKIEQSAKTQLATLLCQHWELEKMDDVESIDQVLDEKGKRIFPGLVFFDDFQVVENPRGHLKIGNWKASVKNGKIMLELTFKPNITRDFQVKSINPSYLLLATPLVNGGSRELRLKGTGYRQPHNQWDPFYPDNIRWMIKPTKSENDSLIYERTKQAVRFFALFYRDNIKKQQSEINFVGLPKIFEWYSGGIGLVDRESVQDSWLDCFYNSKQAFKAYRILHDLIVDYEFNWIKAPSWIYATHSVLEQMYLKMEDQPKKFIQSSAAG